MGKEDTDRIDVLATGDPNSILEDTSCEDVGPPVIAIVARVDTLDDMIPMFDDDDGPGGAIEVQVLDLGSEAFRDQPTVEESPAWPGSTEPTRSSVPFSDDATVA